MGRYDNETEITAMLKGYKKTSKEVLDEIIGQTSLKFTYLCASDPTDKMLWLNKTLTYAKFAKHIMDHSWLGENDLPMMYINKNGKFVYDSLQRLKTQGIKYSYVFGIIKSDRGMSMLSGNNANFLVNDEKGSNLYFHGLKQKLQLC